MPRAGNSVSVVGLVIRRRLAGIDQAVNSTDLTPAAERLSYLGSALYVYHPTPVLPDSGKCVTRMRSSAHVR
jgi:hypothetical protein